MPPKVIINPEVAIEFLPFTVRFEGRVAHMYLDRVGLVTFGLGCLLDTSPTPEPWRLALAVPWLNGRRKATDDEIVAEWKRVKAMTPGKTAGYYSGSTIRSPPDAIDALAVRRLEIIAEALRKRFRDFPHWPADAQLGTLSMAWAMGSDFWRQFPKWAAFADHCQWQGCASECAINEPGDKSIARRNEENARLFRRAA